MENEKDLNGSENFKKITDKLVADANRVGESPVNAIEFQEALMNDYSGYSSNILSGDIGRRIDDADWKNAYNSTISGLAQLGNNMVRGTGIINGKLKQAVGTLTDNEEMIDSGVFLQDYYRNLMLNYQDRLSYAYSVKDQSLASEILSKFIIAATSLVPIVATGGVAGGVVAGTFALGAAGEYAADLDSKYDKETWKKVQESKSLDRQFAELGGAGIIGAANYYLDKTFGANPAASNMFGSVIKGGIKKIIKTGAEEALTETAQDLTTPIVQFLMGDKKFSEVVDNIVSRDTFTTLVSSFLVGGGAGGAQYYSAREKVATQIRTAIDNALPDANNAQKSAITEQIVNRDIQGGLTELRSALYADNQLREQYGQTFDRIVNRINDLIDQNIALGELPDWVNIKSPAERAQYVGSVANRFVDELYAQSILRDIPVLEVFNESRIDVENGNMYMYGKNYGRRSLASYRDLSPEEYTAVMVKEQESELALIQNKVSDLQAKYKVQALRLQEIQANEKSKESAIEGAKLRLDKIQKDIDLQTSKINAIQNKILEFTKTKPLSSKKIGSYNPLTGILKVNKGFNETTIPHELSHFWLDNMNKFANSIVGRDTEFAKLWSNIRAYLNIMDGQKYLTPEQYEKYTSAYMQYIRKNTIAPKVDLGFDSMDKWIGKISLDYFMNDLGKYGAELSKITPEIAESLQSITTFDLTTAIKNIQDNPEIMEGLESGAIGKEATTEQMEKVVAKDEKVAKEIISSDKISAVEDVIAAEKEFGNTNVKYPKNLGAVKDTKEKYVYDVGVSDKKSRSIAAGFVKDSRFDAELVANGFMDAPNGISRAFVIEALINEDIAAGKPIAQWAEALVDSASASGAELRASGVIRENKNYLIDMTEVLKARKYAVALRLYPSAINSLRSRSQILQTFDDKVESWIDEVMPQLEKATSPEEISLIATKWAGKHAKELGATPTGNLFQSVAGISGKRTDLVGNKIKLMRKKLREFLESEAGANLTETEQENLRLKEEATIEAMREVAGSDENSFEAEKKVILTAREYQNYKNSLVPQSVWASLFSSIPRASMLFRVSTQLKNFLGTRIENMVLAQINRYMRYGKSDLISDSLIKEEFKRSMKLYGVGNFSIDVQKNFLEQPILAWGEKQYNITTRTTGEGVKKWLFSGLKEEFNKKATDKNALSGIVRGSVGIWERFSGLAFDLLSWTDARAKAYSNIQETAQYASFVAKEMQKENNWSDAETKEQATAIFKDARLFNPKTQLGRNARNMAVDAAKLETFIKAGIFSQAANAFRKKLNFNKEWGIGTFIAPFISTPANILELGLDYTTGFTSWVGLRQVKDRIVQNAKEGKPIDVKDMAVLQRAYRGKIGIAGLALYLIALAAIDDDDFEYVPPYSSLTKEQRLQVFRLNGGVFNAIKFGDIYINVDYFGGLTTPLRLIGTMSYTENLMQTVMATALEIPMAGDLIDEYKSLEQDVNYNKSAYDVAVASFLSQSKKFVPGIVQQIYEAVSSESPAYKIITGSDFGLETGDKEMIDLQESVGAKMGKITSTKGFGGLDRDTKLKIEKEYDADYYKAAREWYESNKTATDEEIKEEFDSIRKNLLKKYKNLYTID